MHRRLTWTFVLVCSTWFAAPRTAAAQEPFSGHTWYVGLEGGLTTGLDNADDSSGVGSSFNGVATGAQCGDGYNVGIRLGHWLCDSVRVDCSYHYHADDYNWVTTFPGTNNVNAVDAEVECHVALFNAFWHPLSGYLRFDPYVGCGIGVAINQMHSAKETFPGQFTFNFAEIESGTSTAFAAALCAGFQIPCGDRCSLDWGVTALHLGEISSGESRIFFSPGQAFPQRIAPYEFGNNWVVMINGGVHWGGR
jgi:hypothetical protein